MPKKEKSKEQFQQDILKLTGDQESKIDELSKDIKSLSDIVNTAMKDFDAILGNLAEKNAEERKETPLKKEANSSHICAVQIQTDRNVPLPQGEMERRAGDVAILIKPIMQKYGLESISATLQKK